MDELNASFNVRYLIVSIYLTSAWIHVKSCSLLAGFHRLSLFNAEKAGAANPFGE